ncbi:Glutamate synthase [NADPH] small chain, partial [hydrothermal vent metagenome]
CALINDNKLKRCCFEGFCKCLGDMPGSEDNGSLPSANIFEEDRDPAATALVGVFAEGVFLDAGAFVAEVLLGGVGNEVLELAATDSAFERAAGTPDHPGTGVSGCRALGLDDRDEDERLASVCQLARGYQCCSVAAHERSVCRQLAGLCLLSRTRVGGEGVTRGWCGGFLSLGMRSTGRALWLCSCNMTALTPYPFSRLLMRAFRELDRQQAIFDLPRKKFFGGDAAHDFSVRFHGMTAGSPLGPSAGPHSQLAQNIVLAWLGGSRIIELKTVQVLDELEIGRPCIDAQTVCYNIEWSQELKIEQSLEEYVKASMLIDILTASGELDLAPGFEQVIFDMSVGYDLAGIKSDRVRGFLDGMMDASAIVDRLRGEIPTEFAKYRDLDFRTQLSESLTLSTFHGCPPEEIERIIDFLLRELGLHCTIKLNPTLLGAERLRELMAETLGYTEARTPDEAFEKDTKWEQMVGFVDRLGETATELGLGLGVKFTNTLIVKNHRKFFPANEKLMYLSGQPLHVLAVELVRKFRGVFEDRFPISFSAGIERSNFADAVALGLVPVTVCTDLLRPGGYARQQGYFQALVKRMDATGAVSIDEFVLRAYGFARESLEKAGGAWSETIAEAEAAGESLLLLVNRGLAERWLSAARVLNAEHYASAVQNNTRYRREKTDKAPKKIGRSLELFDCLTCDKCIPVCPNDANFVLAMPQTEIAVQKMSKRGDEWVAQESGTFALKQKHQIANFHDFCNDCGDCDVFCPEDGGPYAVKPRFFGSLEDWKTSGELDGFFLSRDEDTETVHGRLEGVEYLLSVCGERAEYAGEGFAIRFTISDPSGTVEGEAAETVDLTYFYIMNELRKSIYGLEALVNYVNA